MTTDLHLAQARDVAIRMARSFRWPCRRGARLRKGAPSRGAPLSTAAVAGALCMLAAQATARELATYPALLDALVAGQSVMTLLDLRRCTREGTDVPGPRIQGGSRITRFLIPNGQYVAFADTHQTLTTEDRPVTEYIRYRAMPDGSVTVRFATVAPSDERATSRGQYRCAFIRGIRFVTDEALSGLPAGSGVKAPVQPPVDNGHDNAQQPTDRGDPNQ